MVQDKLRDTRNQVTEWKQQQHAATMKDKGIIIKGLQAMPEDLRSKETTSERLAADGQHCLQGQLDAQRKEKDEETKTLRNQLRKSVDKIKALGGWKKMAEAEEHNNQRASNRFNQEKTTLREKNELMVSESKRNLKGLERTIGTICLTITELERKATSLESGQEVKDLKFQLTEAYKQSQKLTNESKGLSKQLQYLGLKTADLNKTIEDRNCEIEHNKKAWATEKGNQAERKNHMQHN